MNSDILKKRFYMVLFVIMIVLIASCSSQNTSDVSISKKNEIKGNIKSCKGKNEAQQFIILKYDMESCREEVQVYTISGNGIRFSNSFYLSDVHFTHRSTMFIDSRENLCYFNSYTDYDFTYVLLVKANLNTGKTKCSPIFYGKMSVNSMMSLLRNPGIIISPDCKKFALMKYSKDDSQEWKQVITNGKKHLVSVNNPELDKKPYHILDIAPKLYTDTDGLRMSWKEMKNSFKKIGDSIKNKKESNIGKFKMLRKIFGSQPDDIKRIRFSPNNRYAMLISQKFGYKFIQVFDLKDAKYFFIPLGFADLMDYEYTWIEKDTPIIIRNDSDDYRGKYYGNEIKKYYGHIVDLSDLNYDIYKKYKEYDMFFKFPFSFLFKWNPGYKRLRKIYLIGEQDWTWGTQHFYRYYEYFRNKSLRQ